MRQFRFKAVALGGLLLIAAFSAAARAGSYLETVLTSDGGPNVPSAPNTDTFLQNPWGFGFTNTSPFWVGDQNSGVSTVYGATGAPNAVGPVTIPPGTGTSGPTGVVANINTVTTSYLVGTPAIPGTSGSPANFIFDTLNGTIAAWNNANVGAKGTAVVEVTTPGASFTGLAMATVGGQDLLYAVDNAAGSGHSKIDVFGGNWGPATISGNFADPNLPSGSVPFNIQLLQNGLLAVTYQGPTISTASVAIFDVNGNLINSVTDSHLSTPWGVTLAPATFGQFGGDLLVGNRGNGQINAFDPTTLAFIGTLTNGSGQPIAIPGLWALAFRSTSSGFDPNTLYFTAGVNQTGGSIFADGIFGTITAVPEPSSAILLGLGLVVLCGVWNWQVRRQRQIMPALAVGADRR